LMKNPNFLILDEPTNDLDIFTLNVLEDYLIAFEGCLIIVSHDRYFMDKLVDHLFIFEGNGAIKDFPGNYTDLHEYREQLAKEIKQNVKKEVVVKEKPESKDKARKLSFNEKREMEHLEKDIQKLEKEKSELELKMNSGELSADKIIEASTRFSTILEQLDEKEMRWLELSEV
jgi:ATP-binding cassette subfamily F protein uup